MVVKNSNELFGPTLQNDDMKRPVPSGFNDLSDSELETVVKQPRKKPVKKPPKTDDSDVDYEHFDLGVEPTIANKPEQKLNQSLFETNKQSVGLSIMEKMGFSIGDSLGAKPRSKTSITVPLGVEPKHDKRGIGNNKDNLKDLDHSGLSKVYSERKIRQQISKLQQFCFKASGDLQKFVEKKGNTDDVDMLWRSLAVEFAHGDEVERKKRSRKNIFAETDNLQQLDPPKEMGPEPEEMDPEKHLLLLLTKARANYFYCLYCGCIYNDKQDLLDNCPGVEESSHYS